MTLHPRMIARRQQQCDIAHMGSFDGLLRLPESLGNAFLALFGALLASVMIAQPSQAAAAPRIIAVGDLHGDYPAWLQIAHAAGIADGNGNWTAGNTILVQLGDIVDREPDSLQIIRSLQRLQAEAPRSGGRVIVLLGNHEAMNLLGDFRYTTPGEFAAFSDRNSERRREQFYESVRTKIEAVERAHDPTLSASKIREEWMSDHPLGWLEHQKAWSPSGPLGRWASNNPAVLKIGGTLFVHGGLSAEYAKLPLAEVNRRVQRAMNAADDSPSTVLYDPLGPLWYRGMVMRDPDAEEARSHAPRAGPHLSADQEVDEVLRAYDAKRIVIAHTPDLNGIEFLSNGRVARIDSGISRAYGGPLTWLEITNGEMIPHRIERASP